MNQHKYKSDCWYHPFHYHHKYLIPHLDSIIFGDDREIKNNFDGNPLKDYGKTDFRQRSKKFQEYAKKLFTPDVIDKLHWYSVHLNDYFELTYHLFKDAKVDDAEIVRAVKELDEKWILKQSIFLMLENYKLEHFDRVLIDDLKNNTTAKRIAIRKVKRFRSAN